MSVHKSKGLEFPVVFLAELDSTFNKKDVQADILTCADDTLGLQIIDRQSNSKLSSLAHEVIAEQKLSTGLAEEMRILYVATTRARERLILTASQKQTNCRDIITNGYWLNPYAKDQSPITNHQSPITKSIPDWQLRSCRNSLEWVLYALSDQKSLHSAFGTGLAEQALDYDLFSFKLYDQAQVKRLSDFVIKLKEDRRQKTVHRMPYGKDRSLAPTPAAGVGRLAQVKESLVWRYQFGDAYILPAKTSVTQLTHRSDEYIKFDYSRALDRQPSALVSAEPALTKLVEPRLLGTAAHLVISQLDLARPVTEEAIEKTKDKLLADNAITASVISHIDKEAILKFFDSDLGRMVFDTENTILREWPFTFALPAWHGHPDRVFWDKMSQPRSHFTSDEVIIVQGIIDMLIRTPQGLVIIDFKTDNVTSSQVNQRAELYRRQLELYSRAASAILGRRQASLKSKSIAKWLYFLRPACAIKIN